MTMFARSVLADCEAALNELTDCDNDSWRRRWMAVVALLRAVGHVLDKVDGQRIGELRKAIDGEYQKLKDSKPEPNIFWSFIDDERNHILKQYNFRGVHASGFNVTSITTPRSFKSGKQYTVTRDGAGNLYVLVFEDGPFEGRNRIAVAREAILWWKSYLDRIDKIVGASS